MQKKDLETFRTLLLEMRRRLVQNVTHMQHDALEEDGAAQKELSDMPLEHLADRGSDTYAKDLMLSIIQDNETEIADIDSALEKIKENRYGICEDCGKNIPKQRLKALPFARLCIECKQCEENRD